MVLDLIGTWLGYGPGGLGLRVLGQGSDDATWCDLLTLDAAGYMIMIKIYMIDDCDNKVRFSKIIESG